MKKAIVLTGIFLVAFISRSSTIPSAQDDFCTKLKTLLESARNGFESVKGEKVEREITGSKKFFYISKVKFNDLHDCYINDSESYPECECILSTDARITEKLKADYENFKKKITTCLPEGWRIMEQDSTNDFFLKSTEFKKLKIIEETGEEKLKFELFMYSNMIVKKRLVEIKIEGTGKKQDKIKLDKNTKMELKK